MLNPEASEPDSGRPYVDGLGVAGEDMFGVVEMEVLVQFVGELIEAVVERVYSPLFEVMKEVFLGLMVRNLRAVPGCRISGRIGPQV